MVITRLYCFNEWHNLQSLSIIHLSSTHEWDTHRGWSLARNEGMPTEVVRIGKFLDCVHTFTQGGVIATLSESMFCVCWEMTHYHDQTETFWYYTPNSRIIDSTAFCIIGTLMWADKYPRHTPYTSNTPSLLYLNVSIIHPPCTPIHPDTGRIHHATCGLLSQCQSSCPAWAHPLQLPTVSAMEMIPARP